MYKVTFERGKISYKIFIVWPAEFWAQFWSFPSLSLLHTHHPPKIQQIWERVTEVNKNAQNVLNSFHTWINLTHQESSTWKRFWAEGSERKRGYKIMGGLRTCYLCVSLRGHSTVSQDAWETESSISIFHQHRTRRFWDSFQVINYKEIQNTGKSANRTSLQAWGPRRKQKSESQSNS